jgi:hypothetical protein
MFLKNRAYFRSLFPSYKQVSSVPINSDLTARSTCIRYQHSPMTLKKVVF